MIPTMFVCSVRRLSQRLTSKPYHLTDGSRKNDMTRTRSSRMASSILLLVFIHVGSLSTVAAHPDPCSTCCQGQAGIPGVSGMPGSVGLPGRDGLRGEKGIKGEMGGQKGDQGSPGLPGADGQSGTDGQIGQKGERGSPGEMGPSGLKGDQGLKGLPGDNGQPGLNGKPGASGPGGQPGADGYPGPPGPKGYTGAMGPIGRPGHMGVRGDLGERGPRGEGGPQGRPGEKGSKGDIPQIQQSAFSVFKLHTQTGNINDVLGFDYAETNIGTNFNLDTDKFTCGIAGTYVFFFKIFSNHHLYDPLIQLVRDDIGIASASNLESSESSSSTIDRSSSNMAIVQLEVGNQVWLKFAHRGGERIYSDRYKHVSFSGFLLYAG
ncbi:uncharacterized protein [Amphiura filiformis]|uniref:uncharacterized protein n=1 Tax=Amphiura filiformis TaxID=82378 RepID=UPI003B2207D0